MMHRPPDEIYPLPLQLEKVLNTNEIYTSSRAISFLEWFSILADGEVLVSVERDWIDSH